MSGEALIKKRTNRTGLNVFVYTGLNAQKLKVDRWESLKAPILTAAVRIGAFRDAPLCSANNLVVRQGFDTLPKNAMIS